MYQTNREKISKFIITQIIPRIHARDLPYNEVISLICKETYCVEKLAIELMNLIGSEHGIKEERYFTVTPEKRKELLNESKKVEQELKYELEEVKTL